MLDLSRIAEQFAALIGQEPASGIETPASLLDALQNAGVDPGALQGLGENRIFGLLAGYGIDPSQFAIADVQELLNGLGENEHHVGQAASVLDMNGDDQGA